jgi:hypothetical protein
MSNIPFSAEYFDDVPEFGSVVWNLGTIPEVANATHHLDPASRVEYWSTFQSVPEMPYPSFASGWTIDDIAAVIAGSKPAALLCFDDVYGDVPTVEGFLEEEERQLGAFTLGHITIPHSRDGRLWFLGHPDSVSRLINIYQNKDPNSRGSESFHRSVGEALGISRLAINDGVQRIKVPENLR